VAFNPFSGQFEANQAVATLDPVIHEALLSADKSTDEDVKFVKEHVLKNKLHIKQLKHDVAELDQKLENLVKNLENKETLSKTELESQKLSLEAKLEALSLLLKELKDKPAPALPALVDVTKVKVDEAIAKRLESLETQQREEHKANSAYIESIVSIAANENQELKEEIRLIKKALKVSYALTVVGVIIYIARHLLA
jgi:hypothetical protein